MKAKKPSLDQCRFFTRAIELGSFSKVAREAKTDVSYIGREIDLLEGYFEQNLLIRNKKGVRATWIGEEFYREIKPIVTQIDDLLSAHKMHLKDNSFRVAVPSNLSYLFIHWISEFESSCTPKVSVKLIQYEKDDQPPIEKFDLFICSKQLPNARIFAQFLGSIQRGIVVSKQLLDTQNVDISLAEILKKNVLIEDDDLILSNGEQSISLGTNELAHTNNVLSFIELIKLRRGYGIGAPLWVLGQKALIGDLVQVLPQWHCQPESVWIIRTEREYRDRRLQSLANYLLTCWSKTPGLL